MPRRLKLCEEFLSSQLPEKKKKNVPAQALMLSLVCFRYRNCVYTYRILPNEDDKFTVQVSPLRAERSDPARGPYRQRKGGKGKETRRSSTCAPGGPDREAWLGPSSSWQFAVGVDGLAGKL